jgi:tetrahydromethanopterin S-methyltransferase subunit F
MGKHSGYKRHMRRRKLMFLVYDTTQIVIGFVIGFLVSLLIMILWEGGL